MMSSNPRTLVVDDEVNIRFLLCEALEKTGHQTAQAESGEIALQLLRDTNYDVIILDLNLGGRVDGLRVLEAIRWRWPDTIVIILTGHGTLDSAMAAIKEGVDGYLLKPVDINELRKIVTDSLKRADLKRAASLPEPAPSDISQGLQLDYDRHCLEVSGKVVDLTPYEFKILHLLLSHPGRVFTARELVREIHQYEPENELEGRELIKWYIYQLRKKIEPDPTHPRYLLNVRGVGYRLGS